MPAGRARGFTLIELLITIALVSVLAAVAFPSYGEYVRRSRITEATGMLATTRVRLEQYYQDNRSFGSTTTACGVPNPTGSYFTFSCSWGGGGTNQSFLLVATGTVGKSMEGFTYTVDHNNAQRTTAFPGASSLPASCWLKRKGDTC